MDLEYHIIEHSIHYLLTETETKIFTELAILDQESPYSPLILVLLKETKNQIAPFMRIISAASKTPGFAPKGLIRKVILLIKEAIVVSEIRTNKYASVTELTNIPRYRTLGINRNLIYKTINKYDLR